MAEDSWLWKKGGGGDSRGGGGGGGGRGSSGAVRRRRRMHGLQLPLHPQQVLGWFVVVLMVALTYGAVVPALHSAFVAPVAAAAATLFVAHLVTHATALALDPAHPLVRNRKDKKLVPEFDRSLHSHVIENGRCHLCNITITSARTKHCSSCNKCVDVFDHHCKWLNNCIGKRNYRVFLATVITAILSCLMIMATCLTEIILYYFNRQYLAPWENGIPTIPPQDETALEESNAVTCEAGSPYCHFSVFGARVYDGAFIGILSALFSLALVAGVLLIHLVAFHLYLMVLGLTTYEYIRGTSMAASTSANSFGGRTDPARDGAACGWNISSRPSTNQITPSSTTDTALLSSPDPPSTTTTSPGTLSPHSNPTTPADDIRHLLGGRHLMVHHRQGMPQQLSPRRVGGVGGGGFIFPTSRQSSVPTLPKIAGTQRTPLRTVSKTVAAATGDQSFGTNGGDTDKSSSDDGDVTVHLVALPRPPRVSRRRHRSSVVPHLSPIKECDIVSSSPPSIRTVSEAGRIDNALEFRPRSASPSIVRPRTPPSILKSSRDSPKFGRLRPSPSHSKKQPSRVTSDGWDFTSKVSSSRDRNHHPPKFSPPVPSPRRKLQPRGVLSKSYVSFLSDSPKYKFEQSPTRPVSAPAQIHIIKKSCSFNGTSRIGTPTLRFKMPNKETNGHIIATTTTDLIPGQCAAANGSLLSIVRSSSDGLLIKMGDVTRGGVYIGPHAPGELTNSINSRCDKNAKAFVEHHM